MPQDLHTEIIDRLARIEETGKSTLAQALKTNGRVTELEEKVQEIEKRESNLMGKVTVFVSIVGLLVAGAMTLVWDYVKRQIYG